MFHALIIRSRYLVLFLISFLIVASPEGETGEAVSALFPSHPVRFLFSVALVRLAALVRSENLLRIVYTVSFAPVPFSLACSAVRFLFAVFA